MNGDELREARVAAGLTQQELADRLKVSLRTVGNWERSTGRLPGVRERQVRAIFGAVLDTEDPLDAVSDMALVAQLTKRLERAARERSTSDGADYEKSAGGLGAATDDDPAEDVTPLIVGVDQAEAYEGTRAVDPSVSRPGER